HLDPRFHEMAVAKLEGDPAVDLVTCSIHVFGPGARAQVVASAASDLDALVGDADAVHSAAAFRRTAWASLGGFDETLPSLEQYEFALRLLHAGRRIAVIDPPLLLRVVDEGLLYRREWERACQVEAVERIVEKHATLFRRDPAGALYARERKLGDVGEEYRRLMARRADALQELERLKTRAGDLRRSLGDEGTGVDLGDLRRTTPIARDWG